MERVAIPKTDAELRQRLATLRAKVAAVTAVPEVGPAAAAASDRAGCADCEGTGWHRVEGGRVSKCACTVVNVHADGVPFEFQSSRLENYREMDGNRTAIAKAREFLTATRDLFLTGTVGTGKTRLACAILNEVAHQRRTCYFVRVPWMLHQLQPGRDSVGLEARLASTSMLVLDDLGAERDQATDYTRRTLLMLYEQRHDAGLRTIFTGNLTLQQLAEHQDDQRLASRLAGQADIIQLTTGDQRRAMAKFASTTARGRREVQ